MTISTAVFTAPAAPLQGTAHLAGWLGADRTTAVTALVDPAVIDRPITRQVLAQVRQAGLEPTVLTIGPRGDLAAITTLAAELDPGALLIAVGGGSTMDLAKLAVLTRDWPEVRRWLAAPQRSGMVMLPARLGSSVRVLAVPTTLGTGSELAPVACYPYEDAKRIVNGNCLRPVASIHDAAATETLPVGLVADGVLEALFRAVSPYAGDPIARPAPDAAVEDLARRLVDAGYEVARDRAAGGPVNPGLRLRIAALSSESQIGHTNIGRYVHAVKAWPIANELSSTLGLVKMRAVAAIWPVLWRRALAGDHRVGEAARITRLWQVVRERAPWLGTDPADGLEQLMHDWQVPRVVPATPADLEVATARAMRAWGAGLPMLGGLKADEVRAVLTEATVPAPTETSAAPAADQ
ncbi:daptide-type RiPP biosynthesis dehydogenase [Actinoplanes sp. N902-109]|uniref:daptide-type RiPP biosynthesis dehydogenase n=1 Tax=Actinoplanes sp. (strain N902-109) TaxID=649831 RepID=UPI0003296474|nr:daptide-type RiPP biosynthesis dehydogenase [Actinoplanes sp. N902-109]AGL13767.1 alcohol dehydrogenase [Actinoplanes sp. N902-109]